MIILYNFCVYSLLGVVTASFWLHFPSQLFERLQEEQPGFGEKIIAVNSDLTLPELALSKEDQSILAENINIVFHCAATIRFNEPLKWVVYLLCSISSEIWDASNHIFSAAELKHFLFNSTCEINSRVKKTKFIYFSMELESGCV